MRSGLPAILLALISLPACRLPGESPTLAGEPVGRYAMRASLLESECGSGHPAPAELQYVVDLRHLVGSQRGYWKLPDGPLIEGTLERQGTFRFTATTQGVAVPSDRAADLPGCTLERTETIEGRFDEGDTVGTDDAGMPATQPEASIAGSTRVFVTATPGSDCTSLLSVYGGPFPTLPCRIEYELAGERTPYPPR